MWLKGGGKMSAPVSAVLASKWLLRIAVVIVTGCGGLLHFAHAGPFGSLPRHEGQADSIRHLAQSGQLREIVDTATGIRLSIPVDIVSGPRSSKWGNNWKASDNRLNIDTLNFGRQRTLRSVYDTLRSIRGRSLTQDNYDGRSFTLQGRDSDGSFIHVQASESSGEVRGLSIVYSAWARDQLAPVVSSVVRSFQPFPDTRPAPTPEPIAPVSPPPSAPVARADPRVDSLREELDSLRSRIKEYDEEKRRREEDKRRSDRDDEIRKEEREKAGRQLKELEDRLRADIDRKTRERTPPPRVEAARQTPPSGMPLPLGKRVAFIVGINNYGELPPHQQLKSAVNDARLMSQTFSDLGFELAPTSENMTRREFAKAWQSFVERIEPGSSAAFFFAGHGVQLQGVNYLLPSDIPVPQSGNAALLQLEALNFSHLYQDILSRKPGISLIILDACRDNPFATQLGRSLGSARGLTVVKPVEGSFVLYSANADEQALDRLPSDTGDEMNSVFTRVLAPMLKQPDVPLQEIARRVRSTVADMTAHVGHKQWPSYYDGLTGNICLVGVCRGAR